MGHSWKSRDELISDVLLWTPSHGQAKGGWPARTYIQQLCAYMGCSSEDQPEAMDDWSGWQERVHAECMTWWWWWLVTVILSSVIIFDESLLIVITFIISLTYLYIFTFSNYAAIYSGFLSTTMRKPQHSEITKDKCLVRVKFSSPFCLGKVWFSKLAALTKWATRILLFAENHQNLIRLSIHDSKQTVWFENA